MNKKTWTILAGVAALFLIFRYFQTRGSNADGLAFNVAEGAPDIVGP